MTKSDRLRMAQWLLIAACLHGTALLLVHFGVAAQLQTLCWKLGNVTVAAFVGYHLDRQAFRDRIYPVTHPTLHMRRAVLMAATIIAVALGL